MDILYYLGHTVFLCIHRELSPFCSENLTTFCFGNRQDIKLSMNKGSNAKAHFPGLNHDDPCTTVKARADASLHPNTSRD